MRRTTPKRRRGATLVLFCLLATFLLTCVAVAVDIGYIALAKSELQRTADAAALAGAHELYPMDQYTRTEVFSYYVSPDTSAARAAAIRFAALNGAGKYPGIKVPTAASFTLEPNTQNVTGGDIVIGQIDDPTFQSGVLVPTEIFPNSVRVTARLAEDHANGSLTLFFARALGVDDTGISATATATLIHATLLPLATSEDKWYSLESSGGDGDNWTYQNGRITAGSDGIPEITIFPDQKWKGGSLPPGNFGALSIGTETAGANDLRRQIDQGPTSTELDYHGRLTSGSILSGKTGMNATVETAFLGGAADGRKYAGIMGHPRYLPVYSEVGGKGTNTDFTLSRFVAVRVMDVQLRGKFKYVTLQPIPEVVGKLKGVRLTR